MSAYRASKAAAEAMCNARRIERAAHGAQVTAIYPLWIKTPLLATGKALPAFAYLRRTLLPPLLQEASAEALASAVAHAFERRSRRVYVPGWLRFVSRRARCCT